MARFGLEIDINARGAENEINRLVARVNRALGGLATSSRSAPAAARERSAIEIEGGARVQALRQQGAPVAEITRAEKSLAQALKDYDLALRGVAATTKKERQQGERALARLQQRGLPSRDLERLAANPPRTARDTQQIADEKFARAKAIEDAKLAVQQRRLANEGGIFDLELERKRLQAAGNAIARQKLRRERQAEREAAQGPAGLFQRVQYAAHRASHPDTDRVASDMPQLGAFLAQRTITTAGYAAGGAALFAVVNGLREGLQAAEKLQRVMVTIENQFAAAGEAADFSGFRQDMLNLARDSGIAADEVATVGFQMKGVYGDTTEAVRETRAAIRATVVTGIEQKELTDSLTAASLAYGVSIEDITDKAIGLEERFGVLARESLKVFGDMATVATQAGLEINELGALVGAVQQASGVSGASIAEGFGRILPAVQESAEEILTLYKKTSQLSGPKFETVASAFAEGRGGDVLLQLVRDFDSLGQAQQNYVTTLLGGRREARFLNALFGDTSKVIQELDRTQSDAGKTSERFANIQTTLSQSLARVRESFRQIFDDLARAGLFSLLTTIAGGAEIAIRAISVLTRFVASLSEAMGGLPGKLAAVAFGLKAISLAMGGIAKARTFLAGSSLAQSLTGTGAAALGAGPFRNASGQFISRAAAEAAAQEAARRTAQEAARRSLASRAGGYLTGIGAVGARQFGPSLTALPVGGAKAGYLSSLIPATGVAGGIAALGAFTAALVATTKTLSAYRKVQEDNDRGEKMVRDKAKTRSLDQLRAANIPKSRSGFFDITGVLDFAGLGATITGNKTGYEVVQEQIQEKTAAMWEDAINMGVLSNSEEAKKALETLQGKGPGGAEATRAALKILDSLSEEERQKLNDLAKRRDTNRNVVETGGAQQILNAEQLTAAFQAGEISYGRYITGLNDAAKALEAADNGDVKFHGEVLAARRRVNAAVSAAIAGQISFIQQMGALAGQDPTALLPQLTAALQNPALLPTEVGSLGQNYLQILQQELQRSIQQAPNAAEAQRLTREGLAVDPATRRRLTEYYVQQFRPPTAFTRGRQGRFSRQGLISALGIVPERLRGDQAAVRAADDARLQENILREQHAARGTQDPLELARIQQRIAALQRQAARNDSEAMQAEMAAADAQRSATSARIGIARSRLAAASAAADDDPLADAQRAVQEARLGVQEAQANNLGPAAVNAAMAQVAEAQRQVRDVFRDRIDAQRELTRAQVERDPVLAAQVELAAADEEMARAGRDPAARARALASRIRADRTMRDAVRAIADSQIELLKVYAEVGGRTVEAAEIGVRQAQDALNRVISDVKAAGGDPNKNAEVNAAKGALAQAQGNARDTRLSETQRNIDVALQLERITVGQAIVQLEALLQVPNITKEQTDNLLLKIKQLRDDVGKDFQFNVPSEIRLPTLYEVRRLSSAERGGGGYQDNRVVQFTMTNFNATDYQGAIDRFAAEMEKSSRVYGQSARAY